MRLPRILVVAVILTLILSALGAGSAMASARTASWVVSVTYQNVGANPANVTVEFYPEGSGTPITFNPLGDGNTLGAGAGASFFIGSVSGLPSPFMGSAVMNASEPVVSTVVQFSQEAGFKMRMLSNGFASSDSSNQYLVATTMLNTFARTTVFSIQNADTVPVKATVKFYDANASGQLVPNSLTHTIPAGSAKYIEMDQTADTGFDVSRTSFNGSAIVTATREDNTTPASVVAAASELYTNKNVGANFEGLPLSRAANTLYMATALCQQFGLDTFYAVQNASLTGSASITVQYYDPNGVAGASDGPYPIGPGQKKSISTCLVTGGGFTGSAKITSTGAPIVAIGKAQGSTGAGPNTADVFTAFMGESQGQSKLALPFVRWSSDANFNSASNVGGKQRAFIAIQNLENSTIKVNVKYFAKTGGAPVATQTLTIPAFAKGSSNPLIAGALGMAGMNPNEFGYYTDNTFGGAVLLEAHPDNPTGKFIAIVRVQHPGAGEDYNGIPVPAQ